MKLGIVSNIGPLDRYGYQYHHATSVGSTAAIADRVYLVQSTRNQAGVDGLLSAHSNVTLVSSPSTWLQRDENDEEVFDLTRLIDNVNAGLDIAISDGMDCAALVHINTYVEAGAGHALRATCERLLRDRVPFAWFYRADQLGGTLFEIRGRRPYIFNLAGGFFAVLEGITDGRETHLCEDFTPTEGIDTGAQYVELGLELTPADLEAKMRFIRCYRELLPKRSGVFRWADWRPYYARKFRGRAVSQQPLGPIGRRVASVSREDFVSHTILEDIGIQ